MKSLLPYKKRTCGRDRQTVQEYEGPKCWGGDLNLATLPLDATARANALPAQEPIPLPLEALKIYHDWLVKQTVPWQVARPPSHLKPYAVLHDPRLWPKLCIMQQDEKDMKTTRGVNGLPDMGDGETQRITSAFYDGYNAIESALEPLRKLPPQATLTLPIYAAARAALLAGTPQLKVYN